MMGEVGRIARAQSEAICAARTHEERAQLTALLLARIADEQGLTPGVHPAFQKR